MELILNHNIVPTPKVAIIHEKIKVRKFVLEKACLLFNSVIINDNYKFDVKN
jgi:hypothetical protein